MAMRFTVTPPDVADKLSRVKFDVTRRMEEKKWARTLSAQLNGIDPRVTEHTPWDDVPWDLGNDDSVAAPGQHDDESPSVLPGGHLFTIDAPGFKNLSKTAPADVELWLYQNFEEFVRVRFDGTRPSSTTQIDGSRCSFKAPWYSRVSVLYVDPTLGWIRAVNNGDNVIAPGYEAFGALP